jgi:glycosyltransferase involved in cell wall biosynthesis
MAVRVFVPRWIDRTITNAQNANARALLTRFADPRAQWIAVGNDPPSGTLVKQGVRVVRLPRSRLWSYGLALAYQRPFDAIFYPGVDWPDEFGMKFRRLSGRSTPVIATMEGLIADTNTVSRISQHVGHPVFAQPGVEHGISRIREMYEAADQIIAISPFLARVARLLYGEKVSELPLGVDGGVFHSLGRREPERCRVLGCGTVKSSKNPQAFLRLAARFQQADFVWYGNGPMLQSLTAEAARLGIGNLRFPGSLSPELLAEEFRQSSILALPSSSEGVPKVTHEAAACGLPVVLNGYYEAPTVIHQHNGLVAWSDEEFAASLGLLIDDLETRNRMGQRGAEMAKEWSWDRIAPQWEDLILRKLISKARA